MQGLGQCRSDRRHLRSAASRSRRWSSATIPTRSARITNYLHYTGAETVVLGGTEGNDILIAGASDDDTVYGDGGNDRIDGGFGNDNLFGGDGDDIITDMGGTDIIHGDAGNDVIFDSHSLLPLEVPNIILGGDGKDFIATWDDISTIFGGAGDDFIYGSKPNLPETGNEGDDWIELGTQDGAPGDNFNPFLGDDVPGNDIFVGGGGFDEMIGEGGDDIFVGSDAQDKMDGMSGFDWVTYKNDTIGVTVDHGTGGAQRAADRGLAGLHSRSLRRSGRPVGLQVRRLSARQRSRRQCDRHVQRQDQRASTLPALRGSPVCRRCCDALPSARASHHSSAPATSSSAATAATSSSVVAATT